MQHLGRTNAIQDIHAEMQRRKRSALRAGSCAEASSTAYKVGTPQKMVG